MKNKTLLLLAAVVFSFSVNAQISASKSAKIVWGDEVKESRKVSLAHIVGADEDCFYGIISKRATLSMRTKEMSIQRFSKALGVINRVELNFESNGVERDYSHMLMIDGKLQLFSSYKNEKLNEKVLFVQEIDKVSLTPKGELKPIASVSLKNQFEMFKSLKRQFSGNKYWDYADRNIMTRSALNAEQFFGIKLSPDSSKVIAVYKVLDPGDKSEIIGLNVYDNAFNTIWSKDVNVAFPDKEFIAQNYEVDNEGNAYVLGRLFNEKIKDKVKGEVNYKYMLLRYNTDGKLINQYPLELGTKFIRDMKLIINNDGQLIVAGFYSNEFRSGIQGSFYNRIDLNTGKVEISQEKDFSIDLITENMSDRDEKSVKKRAGKGKEVGLGQYIMDDIYFKSDGTVALVAEQFFVTSHTSTDSQGNTSTSYVYHYNNILVVNIKQETGEIVWSTKVDKKQSTGDFGRYSSYAITVVDDKMFFIFNDHLKNYKPGETERKHVYNRGKHSVATVVELNENGEYDYNVLFVAKSKDVLCKPSVSQQVSPNELVIYGSSGKTHRFAKVKFNSGS